MIDLSAENAQALCDHGAAPLTVPPSSTIKRKCCSSEKPSTTTAALPTASGVATPLSAVSTTVHTDIEDADWTIDGVKSIIWPKGDDLEVRDTNGMTILLLAAKHGRGHMVEALLAAGADVEAKDSRGFTPACWVSG